MLQLELQEVDIESESERQAQTSQPRMERKILIDNGLVTDEHIHYLRSGMQLFKDLSDDEFDLDLQFWR
jgi:hypothetical protein